MTVLEKAYRVKLVEEGVPGGAVTAAAAEATRKWRGNEVILTYADQQVQSAMVDETGVATFTDPIWYRQVAGVRVRRLGPDAMPLEWLVTAGDLAAFKPGAIVDVTIRARLRHSAWLAGSSLFLKAEPIKANTTPTITVATDALDALAPHLDDLSFLETLTVGNPSSKKPKEMVRWHAGYVRGLQNLPNDAGFRDRGAIAFSKTAIDACHTRGIQVLAGYEIVGTGKVNTPEGEAFMSWITSAKEAAIIAHADAIYQFLWVDRGLDFDGIGFDLEIAGLAAPTENLRILYHRMADLLAPDNRLVTYATATFTVDGQTGKEASHLRSQPFWLARDKPNMIARPMGYDGGEGYHAESIQCALDAVGLHPSQFQMGVKLTQNPPPGLSGMLGDAEIKKRCTELYAPNRVGLIGFALQGGQNFQVPVRDPDKPIGVQAYYPSLNPGVTRSATAGQPLQAPLRSVHT